MRGRRRRWHDVKLGRMQLRWVLAGLIALMVILSCVSVAPQWLLRWELGEQMGDLTAAEKATAINDIRIALLQSIGGVVLVLGAYLTYRQLHTAREGQVTERFTRAVDQLGKTEVDVRLGGIYALERIANDSPGDRVTVAEVLTAFVRGHAGWPPRPDRYPAETPIAEVPDLQARAPDIQAALTVLARRQPLTKPVGRLDLHETDLRKASLRGALLGHVDFSRAHLEKADLIDANLEGGRFQQAHLESALFTSSKLSRAYFVGANLERAHLERADLRMVDLSGATLRGAYLIGADLSGARVRGAELTDADFTNVDLSKVADLHLAKGIGS